jgi:hypothetical protein
MGKGSVSHVCEHCGIALVIGQLEAHGNLGVEPRALHSTDRCRDRLARRVAALLVSRKAAIDELTTAAPAAQWVVNHAPRHDAHDQGHARLALAHIRSALSKLRHE